MHSFKYQRVLEKGEHQQELTFKVNNHLQQNEKKGSTAERFFRRKPKKMLPNTMEREVDWKTMRKERQKEQTKLATQKGKKSAEKFTVVDKIIIQEATGNKRQWFETGIIKEQRALDDGTYHSFIIEIYKGGKCLRNKTFGEQSKQIVEKVHNFLKNLDHFELNFSPKIMIFTFFFFYQNGIMIR